MFFKYLGLLLQYLSRYHYKIHQFFKSVMSHASRRNRNVMLRLHMQYENGARQLKVNLSAVRVMLYKMERENFLQDDPFIHCQV